MKPTGGGHPENLRATMMEGSPRNKNETGMAVVFDWSISVDGSGSEHWKTGSVQHM